MNKRDREPWWIGQHCKECGIPLSDGYALGCNTCCNRRTSRLLRGHTFSPTGFPGEMIDNRHPKGLIVPA